VPRAFSPATAEQVIAAVEAILVHRNSADPPFVASFLDVPLDQAEAGLHLAVDMGFLAVANGKFSVRSPLCEFVATPTERQKAAVLRIVMESYEPFVTFRQRLTVTTASEAARETKVLLDLDAHREEIKDTLISLGTYSGALVTEGGGHYRLESEESPNPLEVLAVASADMAAAEERVRTQLGADASGLASRDEVIIPLAEALLKARDGDARGAVMSAGNAVESSLTELAARQGVSLAGAPGINAKLDKFDQAGNLPKKLVFMGKYLGHVRNAADHGVDASVGASWSIRAATGIEYVFVAMSFIACTRSRELENAPEI
jgi:hypothetical protein